jgi:hypothetical protein
MHRPQKKKRNRAMLLLGGEGVGGGAQHLRPLLAVTRPVLGSMVPGGAVPVPAPARSCNGMRRRVHACGDQQALT